MLKKSLNINGVRWKLIVDPLASLAALLQYQLQISQNDDCGSGDCEDCFIIINGEVALACTTILKDLPEGAIITTKEGMTQRGSLPALQLSWVLYGSPGCNRCAGKIIGVCAAMLEINPFPSRKDIEGCCNSNSLRCCRDEGTLQKCVEAVQEAARVVRGEVEIGELASLISTEKKIIDIMHVMQRNSSISKGHPRRMIPELGIRLPSGTLNLALVRSGVSNAKLMSIAVDEAWTVPGVYRIITSYDVLGSNILSYPIISPEGKSYKFNRQILCREEIKHKYEVIAVVCADSQHNALTAARKISATYKFFDQDTAGIETDRGNLEPLCHPEAYNAGFAHLDDRGKVVIYSKYPLPDFYRSAIAKAIGLNDEHLELKHGNVSKTVPIDFSPVMEAILGIALLSTGRPVFLKCTNYAGKNSGSVTVQWSSIQWDSKKDRCN